MGNSDSDEQAIAKALRRFANADRVSDHIKEPLGEIITPLLKGGEIPSLDSMGVAEVLLFIHINVLGYLYSGSDSTVHAVKFLGEYLGRVAPRYKEVGGLLYDLLRHGWVHRFTPERLRLNSGVVLDFQYSLDMNRGDDIKIVEIVGDKRLLISLSLLYSDLLSAIDLFADDIRSNQDLSDVFQKAFETRREPEEENVLRKKSYDRDLEFIYGLLG